MKRSYGVKEHTADVIIRAEGAKLDDLFKNLHRALYMVIFGKILRPKRKGKIVQFMLRSPTPEDLVVDFVNEIAYYTFTQGLYLRVPGKTECALTSLWQITGEFEALSLAELSTGPQIEVKSATYHNLYIDYASGKFRTSVVLDI